MNGAVALGEDREMGSIKTVTLDSMDVLEPSPHENVGKFSSVVLTVKRGRIYPREQTPVSDGPRAADVILDIERKNVHGNVPP